MAISLIFHRVLLKKLLIITILKLSPHSTDLQPLDVACFAPINWLCTKQLNLWLNQWGACTPVRKHNLVNLLGEIWYKGLSSKNVIASFNMTGIFSVDRSKYPSECNTGTIQYSINFYT